LDGVGGDGRGVGFGRGEELAGKEPADRGLGGAAGEAGVFGEGLEADVDGEARIGTAQPMSMWCDDVFATAAGMKAKGVVFAKEPKKEHWGTSAIFEDLEGNKFVLSSR